MRKWFTKTKASGVERVFINLCKGFDQLKINYTVNMLFKKIKPGEPVVVLGVGEYALQGYKQPNPVIAGIGLMTHPFEWPCLCQEYPVVKYLQHSAWTNAIYEPYFGEKVCSIWFAGIDTDRWSPVGNGDKQTDILIYNKIMWDKNDTDVRLRQPVLDQISGAGLSYREITYGNYTAGEYYKLLQQCRAMIFLCEHESQGFACCEALAMNVPVFAWNQGYWLDPKRFKWNDPVVEATSIPYFNENCGMEFKDYDDFEKQLGTFWQKVKNNTFKPREYIIENLTLKKSAEKMMEIINEVYPV